MRVPVAVVVVLLLAGLSMAQEPPSRSIAARDELNAGVQAFQNVKYEQAIEHFRKAADWVNQRSSA